MTENFPQISIITIVLNGAAFIEKCIESVLREGYPNLEYIIIDGGSTDGTLEIIEKYRNRVHKIVSERDKGISDAFNKGLSYANGELIGILNADDYYEPGVFGRVANTYNEAIRSGIATPEKLFIIYGNLRVVKLDVGISNVLHPYPLSSFPYHQPLFHPATFISAGVYGRFKYDNSFKIAMDYDLMSKIYKEGAPFLYVDATFTNMTDGGLSNRQAINGFREVYRASVKNLGINKMRAFAYLQYKKLTFSIYKLRKLDKI